MLGRNDLLINYLLTMYLPDARAVSYRWTGLLERTTEMDYWNGF